MDIGEIMKLGTDAGLLETHVRSEHLALFSQLDLPPALCDYVGMLFL